MASIPHALRNHNNTSHGSWSQLRKNLNFYRLHVLFFTFIPLIAAGIFFASNGRTHVAFIDALFLCVSAMTVTGLATIDLSSATPWQQVILFILMCLGSPVTVSWVMVLVRRYFFAQKFEHVLDSQLSSADPPIVAVSDAQRTNKLSRILPWTKAKFLQSRQPESSQVQSYGQSSGTKKGGLHHDMVRRVEFTRQWVDPSALVESPEKDLHLTSLYRTNSAPVLRSPVHVSESSPPDGSHTTGSRRSHSYESPHHSLRTPTIEFIRHGSDRQMHQTTLNDQHTHRVVSNGAIGETSFSAVRHTRGTVGGPEAVTSQDPDLMRSARSCKHGFSEAGLHPAHTATMRSSRSIGRQPSLRSKEEDFGGFPYPHVILLRLLRKFFSRLQQRLERTVTLPHTPAVQSQRGGQTTVLGATRVSYISFDAIVGRNSKFHGLTSENLEELGGIEYRALNMLLWIIGLYHIGVPLVAFVIVAPYISQPRWADIFRPPQQHRYISPVWYSFFQVISAYTNSGMSLVDQSMVPFQKAYPEVLTLPFIILVGNAAFPVFLRFVIWVTTRFVSKDSRAHKTLHFLLDHPRRCFVYLFPSHQTWFLLFVLFLLTFTDWFFFLVLDIGNPAMKAIPVGTRVAIGLLQATAVRSAGFSVVLLSALVPAVKVLYVVMMYVSVYPIAMSVRSTNVYEERSLGIYEADSDEDPDDQPLKQGVHSRARIWGKYLVSHARKQLSFDMWWMAFALFLVCIVEKGPLQDETNAFWFNIFTIIFEITSAYGTVGLSLGMPNANYSFSGALKPFSKLIICAVMLRGRHRGLPLAIDRAVLLPAELWKRESETRATAISFRKPGFPGLRDTYDEKKPEYHSSTGRNQQGVFQTVEPKEMDITSPQ